MLLEYTKLMRILINYYKFISIFNGYIWVPDSRLNRKRPPAGSVNTNFPLGSNRVASGKLQSVLSFP